MTDHIAELWKCGEELASQGKLHDALVSFLKAKAFLIEESKKNYNSAGVASITKILGEIMMKLNESIEKYLKTLQKDPIMSLRLKHGYTRKDVKKAYKMIALMYHPDKNLDCDTSCIFTTVQAAYEILLVSAPPDPTLSAADLPNTQSHATHGKTRPPDFSSNAPAGSGRRGGGQSSSSATNGGTSDSAARSSSGRQRQQVHTEEASGVASMSSAQLRAALYSIGFDHLERAGREELIRKYLAAKSHFGTMRGGGDKGEGGRKEGERTGGWRGKMAAQMREERMREWEREASTRTSRAGGHGASDGMGKDGKSSAASASSSSSHSEADKNRQERVQRLQEELPIKSIGELRRLADMCGVSTVGCLEKQDLLQALFSHYGLSHTNASTVPTSATEAKGHATPRESEVPPVRAQENYHKESEKTVPKRRRPMESNVKKEMAQDEASNSSFQSAAFKNVWTRERLAEMERKLRGNRIPSRSKTSGGSTEVNREVPYDDPSPQTRIDSHLEAEARSYQQYMSSAHKEDLSNDTKTKAPPQDSRSRDNGLDIRFSFGCHNDDDDNDDDGIEWMDKGRPSRISSDFKHTNKTSTLFTSANIDGKDKSTSVDDTSVGNEGADFAMPGELDDSMHLYSSVYLPTGGIGIDFDSASDDEEEGEGGMGWERYEDVGDGSSGDEHMARPDISPSDLKARRLRKFSREIPHAVAAASSAHAASFSPLKAKHNVASNRSPQHTTNDQPKQARRPHGMDQEESTCVSAASSADNSPHDKQPRWRHHDEEDDLTADLMNLLGTVHINKTVHVGVSLLSDDDFEDDDEEEAEEEVFRVSVDSTMNEGSDAGSCLSSLNPAPSLGKDARRPRNRASVANIPSSTTSDADDASNASMSFSPSATAWQHRE